VRFEGVAIYERGAFEMPFGRVPIAEACAASIATASPLIAPHPTAHGREHSLEMQLPFLRRLLPEVPIVPLLMAYQTRDVIEASADALARLASGRRLLLVASTDLSHYLPARAAIDHDSRVQQCVAAFDPERLLAIFEQYPEGERGRFVACGGGPAIAVMLAARARNARHARVLKYMHSGEISGDHSGVVGYLAAAMGNFTDVH
jgi:AmmeMemoRadiSam system protein B